MNNNDKSVRNINITITVLLIIILITSAIALIVLPNLSKIADIFLPLPELDTEADFIRFFNVDEADSALICSNGQKILIDTATSELDNELCAKIRDIGIKNLDGVFLSHLHDDHTGGLLKVAEQFKISNLIVPDLSRNDDNSFFVKKIKNDLLNNGGRVYTAVAGMTTNCGEFEITVLGYYGSMGNENDRSIFIMVRYNDIKALFTGDAEQKAEQQLIADNINFDCDILKVAHHGSDSSSSEEFLKIASPRYAVISCGVKNQYSHPSDIVLDRLSAVGADIKRTDLHGDITFHFYSDEINVSTELLIEN